MSSHNKCMLNIKLEPGLHISRTGNNSRLNDVAERFVLLKGDEITSNLVYSHKYILVTNTNLYVIATQ